METTNKIAITPRRKFLAMMAQGGGLMALGGMIWTGYLEEAKSALNKVSLSGLKAVEVLVKRVLKPEAEIEHHVDSSLFLGLMRKCSSTKCA